MHLSVFKRYRGSSCYVTNNFLYFFELDIGNKIHITHIGKKEHSTCLKCGDVFVVGLIIFPVDVMQTFYVFLASCKGKLKTCVSDLRDQQKKNGRKMNFM